MSIHSGVGMSGPRSLLGGRVGILGDAYPGGIGIPGVGTYPLPHWCRSDMVNSNMFNSKFHFIRSFCEMFSYHFMFKMNG